MKHWMRTGITLGLCAAVTLAGALPAFAATSVYPNGGDGGDGNLDGTGGFFPESRQLDFDFLTQLFDKYLVQLVPTWNSGGTPVWTTITSQAGASVYGLDNNANGIVDTDHYDALAAVVNGGAAAATGVAGADVTAIQTAFSNNRNAVQQRELVFPAVQITALGGIINTTLNNVATGSTQTIVGNSLAIPSLWSRNEADVATGGRGVLAGAGDLFELCMRDIWAAEMTLCPGASTTELTHIQSFLDVFIRKFIATALPTLLASAGNVTADNSNYSASPGPNIDITLNDPSLGNIRVRITSANTNTAIINFKNSFNCTNFTCANGAGTLAASGDLNRSGNTNAASYAAAATSGKRQNFMTAEGITVHPLQFLPINSTVNGFASGTLTLGDDEYQILGGDATAKAYDWETLDVSSPEFPYTFTAPPLGGTTSNATYVYNPISPAQNGVYHSVQVADNSWTRTLPAFSLVLSGAPPAPTVSSISVTGAQTIVLTYSSAVTTGATTAANYALSGSGKGSFSTNPDTVTSLGSNQYQLTWNSPQEMQNGGGLTVTVTGVQDSVGQNLGSPNSASCTSCAIGTAPTIVSIVSQNAGPTNVATINYLVTFSESVTVPTAGTFSVTTTVTAAGTVGTIAGSGSSRTVPITGITGTGTVRLDLSAAAGIEDLAGNALALGANGNASQVDRDAPAVPTVDLDASSDSGASNTDNYTNDNTPTLSGVTEAGATVNVTSSVAGAIGTTTANGSGVWTVTAAALTNATHSITATATDAVGNVSVASTPLLVTVDTVAPAVPSIPDLQAASDAGSSSCRRRSRMRSRRTPRP